MAVEIRVVCEQDGCREAEHVADAGDHMDITSIVSPLPEDRFHFTIEGGWLNAPEGWTLDAAGKMCCPNHGRP